ncbi:PREDICTED: disintegrin and metalloproteinase domain-containing protein 32-like, partial [Pygoscelis adeliae]|uniref:disintegrin and metalloproteinase domain-containing protein 32-like n=1 Tax=Pygoscelis adeliae TaxID=9238 RepID=UPI0004F4F0D1
DAVSYVLTIEGRPYTVHLQQQFFLSDDFRIYTYNEKGSLRSDLPHVKGGCYYRGYIDGFPSSAVTLSTCSGLRGLLQFENVSYGIEPLGYSPAFEHFVYRVSDEKTAGSLFANSHPERGPGGLTPLPAAARSPKYFKVYVVLDKALYDYMGSDTNAATQKIIQVFNLVNNMFNPVNVTIVLSSVELWTEENKISTAGEADDLLQRFLQWKQSHLALRSYDIAYLLVRSSPMGGRDRDGQEHPWPELGSPRGKRSHGSPALSFLQYQGAVTLESFSVLLAQLLGRSLGISYDDSRDCHCPGRICLMSPEALRFSGAKAFSSCSIRDFETFLKHNGGACLFNRPRLTGLSYRRKAVCGNGVVEPGEQCDCGAAEACLKDKCCTKRCRFKPGVKCSSGLCCKECQFKPKTSQCRPPADAQCDLPEFCNGSSTSCPPDLYVQDGHGCEHGTGYCYKGRCQGLLQFENVSYGIEPLGYSPAFEHFVYRVSDEKTAGSLFANSHPERGPGGLTAEVMSYKAHGDDEYDYLGADEYVVTQKIVQVSSLLSSMFRSLNLTVTLSSMEVWMDNSTFKTTGDGEEVLVRLLEWKQTSPALQPHEVPYLLLRFSGAKAFSSCSIGDFETFLKQNRDCPFIRHAVRQPSYRAAVCGNSVVEPGEQCDCGAPEACALDKCCTPQCNFKPGMKCSLGLCCENCQFKPKTSQCRPPADAQCDLPEFCNGSSASCPPDLYVQDGHGCEHGTGYCYKGRCQSPDLQCQALYGKGAKNAPLACYEEVNSQQDRFGHCGNHPKDGYQPCSWPNLGCGKLVCTYPNRIPFTKLKGAIIYAQVQEHLCVSFDFMRGPTALDPLLVKDGTKCGPGKVCMNGTCHPHSVLKYDCNMQKKCHGHGVCNNKNNCHCDSGWNPPRCKTQGSSVGGSIDSTLGPDHTAKSSALAVLNNWLLLSFGVVLALVCGTVMMTKWSRLKRFCARRGLQMDGVFLPEDFRIYTDGRGGLAKSELAHIKRDCFYEGYIEGFPVSLVALSICSGLSGILQLTNASYGIKPLETAAGYQHLVYPMWNKNVDTQLFVENNSLARTGQASRKLEDTIAVSTPPVRLIFGGMVAIDMRSL